MNSDGQVLDKIAGPIEENDDLSLVCEAFGKLKPFFFSKSYNAFKFIFNSPSRCLSLMSINFARAIILR